MKKIIEYIKSLVKSKDRRVKLPDDKLEEYYRFKEWAEQKNKS